jgi:hypothetical protein
MEAAVRTNADLTVYNLYTAADRSIKYWRHQIKGVAWENRKASNTLAPGGRIKADQATIYIPIQRGNEYLDPRAWRALSSYGNYWTLQDGDVVVRGLVDDELSASFTLSDLKRKYNDVLEISSVDAMTNGSIALQHWKVSAG